MAAPHLAALLCALLCLAAPAAGGLLASHAQLASAGPDAASKPYEVRWFGQLTDHFSWANQDTFKQRYLVNASHWCGQNCPILFYCGNEGDIELFAANTGFMWEQAASLHALLVFAEHRFYGQSFPYQLDPTKISPDSTKKLGFLSSEQALADYARLIFALKNHLYDARHSPVIALGGSYGGMLAAWMRMKYPNAVAGALAASAPTLQFVDEYDCAQFTQIVTKDYENYSANCSQSIARSWQLLRQAAATTEGRQQLQRAFHTCQPLKSSQEAELILQMLNSIWVNLAMTDYANPASFLSELPALPIKHVCSRLTEDPLLIPDERLLDAVARASQVYTNYTGRLTCLETKQFVYDPMDVMWDFQSCTEMVMPICSDGIHDMFEPQPFNVSAFVADCSQRWGVRTQVDKVRTLYGGRAAASQQASNIIYSSCTRDPWSAGCPQDSNEATGVHAISIAGACHHEDLRAAGPADSEALKQARAKELTIIEGWIEKHYDRVRATQPDQAFVWRKLKNAVR